MTPTSSLVVATYNWPDALAAVLRSVARQRQLPDEVVIADDGSAEPTRRVVEGFQRSLPVPVVHVWQPDDGFRLAQIRNKAGATARGEYLIQIDGDVVLHPDFVRDHLRAAAPGSFIGGSRVRLGPDLSRRVLAGEAEANPFARDVKSRGNALHLAPLGRAIGGVVSVRDLAHIRGCNMSYWRSDFLAVNGYDEEYVGWGREDTDLVVRFHRRGLRRRWFKLQGIVYHLHHRERSMDQLAENDRRLEETRQGGAERCERGVSQYLGAGT